RKRSREQCWFPIYVSPRSLRPGSVAQVPHLLDLGPQVLAVVDVLTDVQRHPLDDLQAETGQRRDLTRVVGEKPQALDAQVDKHLGSDPVVPQVGSEAQPLVGFYRVGPCVLQLVSLEL